MSSDINKPVLDAQARHWESTLKAKPEVFGRDPSAPAIAGCVRGREAAAPALPRRDAET